jgi:hypothetical protein
LQGEKILVRLEVWISLGNCKQPSERAGELPLHFLEFLEGVWVGENIGRDLHLRRLSARLYHFGQEWY